MPALRQALVGAVCLLGACQGTVSTLDTARDGGLRSDAGSPDRADAGTAEDAPRADASRAPDAAATPDATTTVDARVSPVPGAPTGPAAARPPEPPPDRSDVVDQVAAERPDLVAGSCVPDGGSNEFLLEVLRRLRAEDDRWGLNWKRGVEGDLSQDVIDYHWGDGVSEGSPEVYILDIIVGHCGPAPAPGWLDQTEATAAAGTIGRWTLAGHTDL